MQMTVSSEIENRIDDSNSTAERKLCDSVLRRRPWVETDMLVGWVGEQKKAGPPRRRPPFFRVVSRRLGQTLGPWISAQAGNVVGPGLYFPVIGPGGDLPP